MRILLIEDNPGDVALISATLTDTTTRDLSLTLARRLRDGLALLDAVHFDVVLLDLSLPDAQGFETIATARLHTRDTPIVVLTGLADDELALRAVQAGAQDYLVKGADGPTLLRSLRYAIERHRMVTALRSQALHDDLTGLYNRRGFVTVAEQLLEVARRRNDVIVLIYSDLDGMKRVNDTYGHLAGDQMLIEAAGLLRATVRDADVVGRLGGDEFAIAGIATPFDGPQGLVGRLERAVAEYNLRSGRPVPLSLSFGGVSAEPSAEAGVAALLAEADERMYERKRQRRFA